MAVECLAVELDGDNVVMLVVVKLISSSKYLWAPVYAGLASASPNTPFHTLRWFVGLFRCPYVVKESAILFC